MPHLLYATPAVGLEDPRRGSSRPWRRCWAGSQPGIDNGCVELALDVVAAASLCWLGQMYEASMLRAEAGNRAVRSQTFILEVC